MADLLRDVTILGVHPVVPSEDLFEETLEAQWGSGLTGDSLREARQHVRDHFQGLYLIELKIEPPSAEVDWSAFTQPRADTPEEEWQVPYDEQPLDESSGRWIFFLHEVVPSRPLRTPVGPRELPAPSPCPAHLAHVEYASP
jgi:hypothetical protein